MLNKLSRIILGLIVSLFLNSFVWAADAAPLTNDFYADKATLITQQIELLKIRVGQAQTELQKLQKQQDNFFASVEQVNRHLLTQTGLDIAIARSNLESINIELVECQQAVTRFEKDVQELQNQLNVFSIFGLKIARNGSPNLDNLRHELEIKAELLRLEKARAHYLRQLQEYADNLLQLNKTRYAQIESTLKSQTILLLREQQAKSELGFEQRQGQWLQRLHGLELQLKQMQQSKQSNKMAYYNLQNEIFYVNENVNFIYMQMLIVRYEEQLKQLKVSLLRGSSITLLNKASEQAQALGKQLLRLKGLLENRLDILLKRKAYFLQASQLTTTFQTDFTNLAGQYKTELNKIAALNEKLLAFHVSLDQMLQQELASRQGLPGLGAKAWLDVGGELLLIPMLALQAFKSLSYHALQALQTIGLWGWVILLVSQALWLVGFSALNHFLRRIVKGMPDHELGHINLKWLTVKLLQQHLIDIAIIGDIIWLLYFIGVPMQNFSMLINLAFVWLLFKLLNVTAHLCLVETVHDTAEHDVRLYRQLKWLFRTGGIVTALTVFIYQLPLIYEAKDLFNRLFLLFLLVLSVYLLKQWKLLPGIILPHIDEKRTYLKRIVSLLGLLIPLILLVNSIIGLMGFVNLILTTSWYESIFICVLVGYLIIRGLLNDGMEWVSRILIRHVTNGWLWTEAFLKPIDRVLRLILFFSAWIILFLLYGWDQQSPVVERLNNLLHYHLLDVLNTTITPLSIVELVVIISMLYWAARWTREFMYRLLLSRTKDLGLRNSIAILSQYAMIVIGVFICLRLLGIDFRALTVVATAFAFGVGLGLRDLVNNFASGFLLLIERPLRVGDTISINNYEGDVTHIGGRAVTIRTWDHMDVLIPNAEIFSKSFTNWTAKDNIVRTVITVKISRQDNPHAVQELIYKTLQEHKEVLADPPTEVFLKELAEGSIELEVRYYVNLRQIKSRVGMRSEILLSIWDAFERHGIQAPYPHQEIYLKNAVPLEILPLAAERKNQP